MSPVPLRPPHRQSGVVPLCAPTLATRPTLPSCFRGIPQVKHPGQRVEAACRLGLALKERPGCCSGRCWDRCCVLSGFLCRDVDPPEAALPAVAAVEAATDSAQRAMQPRTGQGTRECFGLQQSGPVVERQGESPAPGRAEPLAGTPRCREPHPRVAEASLHCVNGRMRTRTFRGVFGRDAKVAFNLLALTDRHLE